MMRNWQEEEQKRVSYIQQFLQLSGAKGIIYGNSGGKDSALVGILCRKATSRVLGVIMPCGSSRNYGQDKQHALLIAKTFDISVTEVDLTDVRKGLLASIGQDVSAVAQGNIAPRLRMTTLYALGQSLGYVVAGTGNRSEATMGYFTKWGDGAHDFNPIGDLTVHEIWDFLRFLGAPAEIIEKAPSAGLFEGQTDEGEMGITYAAIDEYLLQGIGKEEDIEKINRVAKVTQHKKRMPYMYPDLPK